MWRSLRLDNMSEPEITAMVIFDNEIKKLEIPCESVEIAEGVAKHFNAKKATAWVRIRPFE